MTATLCRRTDDGSIDDYRELLTLPLPVLAVRARSIRDKAYGGRVTYSPKVFIPLTTLCRDRCGYCTFAESPRQNAGRASPVVRGDQIGFSGLRRVAGRPGRSGSRAGVARICRAWGMPDTGGS